MTNTQKMKVKDTLEMELRKVDGGTEKICIDDMIVNIGRTQTAKLLGGIETAPSTNYFKAIGIGTLDTGLAAANTLLAAEVTRASSTNSIVTVSVADDTLQAVSLYTFTGPYTIKEAGLFDTVTANTTLMLCRTTFGGANVSVVSGDALQMTYKITMA